MSKGFRGRIREVVEFIGREAFKDTDRVRARFDILEEKDVEIEGEGLALAWES